MALFHPPAAPSRSAARGPRHVRTTKTAFTEAVLAPGAFGTVFQPIVRSGVEGCRVHAQECLTRGAAETPYADVGAVLAAARHWGLGASFDRARVVTAFETVARSGIATDLFISVQPETLLSDAGFPDFLAITAAGNGIDWMRLTVEVSEAERDCEVLALAPAFGALKQLGIRIALDDYGSEATDVRPLESCACSPHTVKVDGTLFQAASKCSVARRRVEGIVTEAYRHGIDVVAEGVDRDADLRLASHLGIELVQGSYLSGPLPAECAVLADLVRCDLALSA